MRRVAQARLAAALVPFGLFTACGEAEPGELRIDPAALVGCRSPSEPGCEFCYFAYESGICVQRLGASSDDTDATYAGALTIIGPCPTGGPSCASCSKADERHLRTDKPPASCACNGSYGVDPCFTPTSCDCFCFGRDAHLKACPPPP
ncbi:MAG: hypothetical protein QM756_21410 [Polyangiaceae bacterium]